jgi:hypothetical protein
MHSLDGKMVFKGEIRTSSSGFSGRLENAGEDAGKIYTIPGAF